MYSDPSMDAMDFTKPMSSPNRYTIGSSLGLSSLKNQFYPGCSPGTLMGPLDIPDLQQKLVSSMESQHGSLLRMISGLTPTAKDSTMCRDYTCCGIHLSDLHALVEHFEEHHVVVMESPSLQPLAAPGLNPNALAVAAASTGPSTVPVTRLASATSGESSSLVDPPMDTMDEMELDVDIDDSHSSSGSGSGSHSGASTPSPPLTPVLPFDTTAIRRPSSTFASIPLISGGGSASTSPRLETAFNRYAEYTEFSAMLPGTITSNETSISPGRGAMHSRQMSKSKTCLPPALLSSNNTPQTSRAPSPTTPTGSASSLGEASSRQSSVTPSTSTLSRPASSLLLAKPFRCPKPGCNKSYKQANGLKYHLQHGSCNFAPRDESIDCLSEKEAEARLKPYQCQVPPCTRRYKNMNGLRYHYQHSGAHGAIGLALLASGQHEHVHSNPHDLSAHAQYQVKRSRPSSVASSANSSARSSPAPSRTTTPLPTPTLTQSQARANGFLFQHHQHANMQHSQQQQQQMMMADVSMAN